METMKAVVYDKISHPDKLVYCDVDKPVPNKNELLIKVQAVSLTYLKQGHAAGKVDISLEAGIRK